MIKRTHHIYAPLMSGLDVAAQALGKVDLITLFVAFVLSLVSWRLVFFVLRALVGTKLSPEFERKGAYRLSGHPRDQDYLSAAQTITIWVPLLWLIIVFPGQVSEESTSALDSHTLLMLGAVFVWLAIYIYNLRYKGS